jgi:hypothetical protein
MLRVILYVIKGAGSVDPAGIVWPWPSHCACYAILYASHGFCCIIFAHWSQNLIKCHQQVITGPDEFSEEISFS